jgi:tetratricopeptide (TPR) repeat protein
MAQEKPFDPDAGISPEQLARERKIEAEERAKNPELWKKNNEWLGQLSALLEKIKPEDAEEAVKKVERFMAGEITWAELQGVPHQVISEMAEYGYSQFQRGKLKEAETIFKGLSVLDHKNGYYHTILGAIYQRMDKLGDALAEYTVAIELNGNDIPAHVNRGEIYYRCGYVDEPMADFEKAISLDSQGKDPWANRARYLKNTLLQETAVAQAK